MHENPQSNTNKHRKTVHADESCGRARLFTSGIDFLVNARGKNQVAEEITRGWRYNKSAKRPKEEEEKKWERERERETEWKKNQEETYKK